MALLLADRVQETTTTTGTGTITLAGAVTNFVTFSSVLSNSDTTFYVIVDSINSDWEVGEGTYSSNTLSRDTVKSSSNAGSLVNFGTGTKTVFISLPADEAQDLITDGLTTSTTFGGDVSGTYNAIVVADDSHNHTIANVDGLQTALNGKQPTGNYLTTSTTFGGDVSGTYDAIAVTNDSHTHAFANLTGKTAGTGEYRTNSNLVAGQGSGSIAMTINDGYGNSNLTFNHRAGTPDNSSATQSACRIETSTDSNTGSFSFEIGNSTVQNTPVALSQVLYMTTALINAKVNLNAEAGLDVTGDVTTTGTITSSVASNDDILRWGNTGYLKRLTTQGGFFLGGDSSGIIHAGDQEAGLRSALGIVDGTTTEVLHLVADGTVQIRTNWQFVGDGNDRTWTFGADGNLIVPGNVDGRDVATDGAKLDGIAPGAQVNVGTNISVTENASTVTIASSTGNNDSIAAATGSLAGVMTATDKAKLDASTTSATASTLVERNGSRDMFARLFRSDYQNQASISGAMAFRVNTTDNYIRFCNDKAAIRTFIGVDVAGTNNYTHPSYNGDDFSVDTGALTGATVVSDIDINVTTDTLGHVTDANGTVSTRTLTLANLGYTGATNANNYVHPSYNGDDFSVDTGALTGATVVSDIDINVTTDTLGHVTDANGTVATRTLTVDDLSATGVQPTARGMGWEGTYGVTSAAVAENAVTWDNTEKCLAIKSNQGDTSVGAAYRAVYAEAGATVRWTVTLKGSAADADGLYIRLYGYSGTVLSDGKTHVSNSSANGSPFVAEETAGNQDIGWYENGAVPSAWTTFERSWTVPATGYYSLVILNWSGFSGTIYVRQPDVSLVKPATAVLADSATSATTVTISAENNSDNTARDMLYAIGSNIHRTSNVTYNGSQDLFKVVSGARFEGATTCTSTLNIQGTGSNLDMLGSAPATDARYLYLPRGGGITLYGNTTANHGIFSRNLSGVVSDDVRINSYGGVSIILDTNSNNTSGADFHIGRHSTGAADLGFVVSGETWDVTTEGNLTAYGTVSDIRYKEDIEKIDSAVERLQKINGVTFKYKEKDDRLMGVIAQELLEDDILKLAVYENETVQTKEKRYAVRYEHLTAMLIEAVKEQQAQIEALEAKLAALT